MMRTLHNEEEKGEERCKRNGERNKEEEDKLKAGGRGRESIIHMLLHAL